MSRVRPVRLATSIAAVLLVAASLSASATATGLPAINHATTCPSTLPSTMATTDGASQLITVVASNGVSTTAIVTAWQRTGACWAVADGPWIGRVGVHGIRRHKREGDGATPLGLFSLYSTIYGNAPNPGFHLPYRRLRCGDWWDEDVRSPAYNSFAHVPCAETHPPFDNGVSEPLWLSPVSYAHFAVIGYNLSRTPGLGSAIFLHVSVGRATTGCVALARPLLDRVLLWLRLSDAPHIAVATNGSIETL